MYSDIKKMRDCVLAVGNFDGVHAGHRAVLKKAVDIASELGISSAALTFSPHPRTFFVPDHPVPLLTNDDFKKELILHTGIQSVVFKKFDKEFASLSCSEFVGYLIREMSCKAVVCGENFRFGKGASYGVNELREECHRHGIKAEIVPMIEGINSTVIRSRISEGSVDQAAKLLGYPFSICAPVVTGQHLGSLLGFPTINQQLSDGLITPKHGVYGGFTEINGERYLSVTNIGTRPTVNDDTSDVCAETNILGFSGNLYDQTIRVFISYFIREEKKFMNCDELKKQIEHDRLFVEEKGFSGI